MDKDSSSPISNGRIQSVREIPLDSAGSEEDQLSFDFTL